MTVVDSSRSVEVLSQEDGRRILDEQAQHYLGMSGAEFLRRWDAGEYAENPDRPEVMRLVMLLPLAR